MKKLFYFCGVLLFWSSVSQALPTVSCWGWLLGPEENELRRIELKQASYDVDWYEADISHYGFGADMWYLKEQGIGLIVYNNKTHRSASSTTGFRRIGNTKSFEADLKLYDTWPDGRQVVATVQCGYNEP